MTKPLTVRVPAFAKINLALEVLHKREDGFHELRTIFQTISIGDRMVVGFERGARAEVEVRCRLEIPNNLAGRAAEAVLSELGIKGKVTIGLEKRIPMGGGLGGGSTDAAAVLLVLPALAGKTIPMARLKELAAGLGSDVPFFLLGGTALGLSRGEELYPFPEPEPAWGVLVTPGIHVSTAEAYRDLGRDLTVIRNSFKINEFQSAGWDAGDRSDLCDWARFCRNDFEGSVFQRHPRLAQWKRKLKSAGARPALMTGSGSALFGFFASRAAAVKAAAGLPDAAVFRTLNRRRYRALVLRGLEEMVQKDTWPPQSRYAR